MEKSIAKEIIIGVIICVIGGVILHFIFPHPSPHPLIPTPNITATTTLNPNRGDRGARVSDNNTEQNNQPNNGSNNSTQSFVNSTTTANQNLSTTQPIQTGPFVIDESGNLQKYNGSDTNVIVPNNVKSINNSAFSGCTTVKTIVLPNSVTSIGYRAFFGCSNLIAAFIPSSVINFGSEVFYGVNGNFTLYCTPGSTAANNRIVDNFVFYDMPDFNSNDNGFTIVKGVLLNYTGLSNDITIPKGTEIIQNNTFNGISSLTSVNLPDGLCLIGSSAFNGCTGLENIVIPNGVKIIGYRAFFGCSNLIAAFIPSSVINFGSEVFYGVNGNFTITGSPGSNAQTYARNNGNNFKIGSSPTSKN